MANTQERGKAVRLLLSIGRIRIELTWKGPPLAKEAQQAFYPGLLSNGHHRPPTTLRQSPIDARLQVHWGDLPHLTPESMILDAVSNHWRLGPPSGRDVFA